MRHSVSTLIHAAAIGSALFGSLRMVENAHAQVVENRATDIVPIPALFSQLRLTLDRLKSIQYKATATRTHGDNSERPTRFVMEFALQGNLFYSRVRFNEPDTGKVNDTTTAFDGDKYQSLRESTGILQVTSRSPTLPYFMVQPIMVPFLFAHDTSQPMEYAFLLDPQVWDDLAELASIDQDPADEMINGRRCTTLRLARSVQGRRMNYLIHLANDLAYFPVRFVTQVDGASSGEMNVNTVETVESKYGAVVVPTHITTKDYGPHGALVNGMEFSIELASLTVNVDIDEDVFTIPKSRATHYYDEDTLVGTELNVLPTYEKALPELEAVSWWRRHVLLLACAATVICSTAGALVVLRIKRTPS